MRIHTRRNGFSLIEILVVITIIGILAALAIPAAMRVVHMSKVTEAKTFMSRIKVALSQYRNEYVDWPKYMTNFTATTNDAYLPDNSTNWGTLIDILRANRLNPGTLATLSNDNPRFLNFMEIEPKYLVPQDQPLTATNMRDPWGNGYHLALDYNFDNIIADLPDLGRSGTGLTNAYTNATTIAIWCTVNAPDGSDTNNVKQWISTWK